MYKYLFLITAILFSTFACASDHYYARQDRDSPVTDRDHGTPPTKKTKRGKWACGKHVPSSKKKPPSNTEVNRKNYRVTK